MKRSAWTFTMVLMFVAATVGAEEKFGVPVYPGARYDAATTKAIREGMHITAACYRTSDQVAKVAAFYRKQGLESMGPVTAEGGFFKKGSVDVTMQTPWMNMQTGAMMKDTLISIVQNEP